MSHRRIFRFSSHLIAFALPSCIPLNPPSYLVKGHVSTICFVVWISPQLQRGDSLMSHLWSKWLHHLPLAVLILFIVVHNDHGKSNPGSFWIGSTTNSAFFTPASFQRLFHWFSVFTSVSRSIHTGFLDLSLFTGCW